MDKQSKQLHLGKMKSQQIAEWMGISYSTFRKKKQEKLKELKNFCIFDQVYGGVNITEVFEYIYSKQGSASKQVIINNINETWGENGLDTCKRVGEEIRMKYNLPITAKTAASYAGEGRSLLFGSPRDENQTGGRLGRCYYVLCKTEGQGVNAKFVRFTKEEEQIKENLMKKYFGNMNEQQIIVKAMVETGEIKKEEAWDVLEELTNMRGKNFYGFLQELQLKLQCKIKRVTNVERYQLSEIESAF